jgi:cyclopropane-fatty-acyl-phospholipid synthase
MTQDRTPLIAAMQGDGNYNLNSALQSSNLQSAVPLLVEAARSIDIEQGRSMLLADYGASQGRNSMLPVSAAIDAMRAQRTTASPITIVHTDLPSNDFASLFTMLDEDDASYLRGREKLYPTAIGRSYFDAILPPGSVDLGWSSNALHWLSRNPIDVPDHGWAVLSASKTARDAVDAQLDEDWARFLRARASELRSGAKLICQFMGRGLDGHGFEWMASAFWESWVDLARDGLLSSEELLAMTAPSAGRSMAQIKQPFAGGSFEGLRLEFVTTIQAPDPYWDAYQQSGDAAQLGRSWASMMRAANGPNFVSGMSPARDRLALLDAMSERLAKRIAQAPQRSRSYNVLLVLVKD